MRLTRYVVGFLLSLIFLAIMLMTADLRIDAIELMLFDLGGVIIELDFARMYRELARYSPLSAEDIARRFQFDDMYNRHERGEIEDSEYFEHLQQVLTLSSGSDADIAAAWNVLLAGTIVETVSLLDFLEPSIRLCALTNSNRVHERYWRRAFSKVLEPFEQIFVSSSIGHRKPEPQSFEYVSEATGVPTEAMLFFDDTLTNVDGARALGLQAVHVRGPRDVRKAFAELGLLRGRERS